MPKFKPTIITTEKLENKTFNIKIRVTHGHKARYVATEYYVSADNFDKKEGKVVISKKNKDLTQVKVDRINNKLTVLIAEMIQKCDARKGIRFMDIVGLMELLRDKRKEHDVISVMDDRVNQYEKVGNYTYGESFHQTREILKEFSGSFIQFETVDYNFLKRLEFWMKGKQLRTNTIWTHMRNIRTVLNQAITMGLMDLSQYPFRRYKLTREKTLHRTMAGEEIALLYRKEIKDPLMAWARDMAMLSFFLIGINMKDLMYLKQIEDGRVNFIRSKGKRPYSVKVYPEAMDIINRYRGEKYLLDSQEKYAYYRYATKRINKKLRDLADDCKIDKPITTYYMRHSWATIAHGLQVPMDDISYALGHQDQSLEMTIIYVDRARERIDAANRKVIDHIINMPPAG